MGIPVHLREELIKYVEQNKLDKVWEAIEENREMQTIREQAVKDGQIVLKEDGSFDYALAPNGKKSNLNERQWLQVRTTNFKNWFGDWINDPANASKVIDENGEPLVVYHHSDNPNLTKFSTEFDNYFSKDDGTKKAIFFDEEKTGTLNRKYDIPVFLNIKELNEYNETKQQLHDRGTTYRQIVNESAEKNDIDGGVHMKNFDDNKKENQSIWIVHNPNQIKSATDNNGDFSRENDDIQMMVGDNSKNNSTFAENTVENFERILNNIVNGKQRFNNLTEEENDVARRDKLLAAAGIQARRNESPNREESQDSRNERQERQVEEWARQAGVWHDDALAFGRSFGIEIKGGQESHVYESPEKGIVVKVKNTTQYHDLREFLDGIILHNALFPETAYNVLGFGNDGEGFVVILEQPFVKGEIPTQEQIDDFIKTVAPDAIKYETELENGRYKTPLTLIHDISPRNAIITPAGNIAVIDGILRPNTVSEGKGGIRIESDKIGVGSQIRSIGSRDAEQRVGLNDKVQFYKTKDGKEVYGFVTPEGHIYLDETVITPEHPLHEYTHIWDAYVRTYNPKLWKRGVDLMQQIPLWNQIANDKNYGKKWLAQGIKGEELINRIASEVHARLVGESGNKILDDIAKDKGKEGIVAKLKQWLLDVWKNLKSTFSNWSEEEINKLTLKEFNRMTLRDFADGLDFSQIVAQVNSQQRARQTASSSQQPAQQPSFDVSKADLYSGAADGSDSEWAAQAKAMGIKVKDYTSDDYKKLSDEWKGKIEAEYTEARAFLGKPKLTGESGDLTRRDMIQADKADAIFAIVARTSGSESSQDAKNAPTG